MRLSELTFFSTTSCCRWLGLSVVQCAGAAGSRCLSADTSILLHKRTSAFFCDEPWRSERHGTGRGCHYSSFQMF